MRELLPGRLRSSPLGLVAWPWQPEITTILTQCVGPCDQTLTQPCPGHTWPACVREDIF